MRTAIIVALLFLFVAAPGVSWGAEDSATFALEGVVSEIITAPVGDQGETFRMVTVSGALVTVTTEDSIKLGDCLEVSGMVFFEAGQVFWRLAEEIQYCKAECP